ncbi:MULTISPECIES: ABC transporter ATP-binding protein [Paenibacillus]|uniref:ABC transporter ATP-binding protein n=1 Tax=Paenibacillus TaxID=44249 RepID=UPI00096C712E|nr:ABC transporter ATP-binding protein [Paenibacillus odorifer]OME16396.1 ABC transporter [Paenibacillus odorifer]
MKTILSVNKVTKQYRSNELILKEVSLEIEEGSFTVIIGPSGSGKSTLLNIMSGLQKPSRGSVFFGDSDITRFNEHELANFRRLDIGQIFQQYLLLSHLTAEENIRLGVPGSGGAFSVQELAELLDIADVLDQYPGQLSGGQQQRVAIARALIKKPRMLFCDEATGALDEKNSRKVISLLHQICAKYGVTVLFITHNNEIASTADRVITIKDGGVVKDIPHKNPIPVDQISWD